MSWAPQGRHINTGEFNAGISPWDGLECHRGGRVGSGRGGAGGGEIEIFLVAQLCRNYEKLDSTFSTLPNTFIGNHYCLEQCPGGLLK